MRFLRALLLFTSIVNMVTGFHTGPNGTFRIGRLDSSSQHSHYAPAERRPLQEMLSSSKNGGDEFEPLRPETSFGSEAVPEAQRPVNEYLDVTNQPLFGWAATGTKGLLTRLAIFYSAVFGLVCYPISGATFTQEGYLLQKLAASNVGAMFVICLLMIRLYSGWGYVGQRLSSKVVEYEETGWYDGDWEEKNETELRRDRMLFNSEVKPVVDRLKVFTIGSGGLFLASILSFNVALSAKPMFDQYDPTILERLSYDDKLANSAAINTRGRPAYCDSRYYSAVANGGQGCK
jgi:Conserved in the green lineage and diatoms 27